MFVSNSNLLGLPPGDTRLAALRRHTPERKKTKETPQRFSGDERRTPRRTNAVSWLYFSQQLGHIYGGTNAHTQRYQGALSCRGRAHTTATAGLHLSLTLHTRTYVGDYTGDYLICLLLLSTAPLLIAHAAATNTAALAAQLARF
jgi:hypothetical protein